MNDPVRGLFSSTRNGDNYLWWCVRGCNRWPRLLLLCMVDGITSGYTLPLLRPWHHLGLVCLCYLPTWSLCRCAFGFGCVHFSPAKAGRVFVMLVTTWCDMNMSQWKAPLPKKWLISFRASGLIVWSEHWFVIIGWSLLVLSNQAMPIMNCNLDLTRISMIVRIMENLMCLEKLCFSL